MITLLIQHKSEAKPRISVNNKDIIQMHLGCNCYITLNQCFCCEQLLLCSTIEVFFVIDNNIYLFP